MTLLAKGLACGYGGRAVVAGIDLVLEEGAVTVVLGPNGSGKSTLMKTLLGLLAPIGGSVELDGIPLQAVGAEEVARAIAYVPPEERPEFPFLVSEVVAMGRMPHAKSYFDDAEDLEIMAKSLTAVDCAHLSDRPIGQVSAGERQRVLIARALAQQAPIMLMDEPTSHLDPAHQVAFAELVRALSEQGKSLMVAVHDINLAKEIADSALLLSSGGVVAYGSADEVLTQKWVANAFSVHFDAVDGRLFPNYKHT